MRIYKLQIETTSKEAMKEVYELISTLAPARGIDIKNLSGEVKVRGSFLIGRLNVKYLEKEI